MKKVFFSAVALVAFSFAGMANEIEEKKVEVKTIEIKKISDTPCADMWSKDVEFLMDEFGASLDTAMALADNAFEKCLEDMYGC